VSLHPLPFAELVTRMRREIETGDAIFDLPRRKWFVPDGKHDFSALHFGRRASTPVGPAAGPHTQLAQNIVLSWLGGARIMELKTVQINDRLEIPRPCIHAPNVGLNVEWSQELRIGESLMEYAKAVYLIEILKHTRCFGRLDSDAGMDTIFDTSVGYDLAGIRSEAVTGFLDGLLHPQPLFETLRGQLTGDAADYRDLELPAAISDCVTLSTFHGCPASEIESISRYLLEERGFHTIIKLNPTLLGFDRVKTILEDTLGYTRFQLREEAFDADLQYDDAMAILLRLRRVSENRGSMIGAKFTNTLVVANDATVFPTQPDAYMYVSGAPLHVISMNLMQQVRDDLGFEIPISFSAGIDAQNFPAAVACGMVPITTCTDLLRAGGYGRLPAYLKSLGREMDRLGASTREAYVLAVGGNAAAAIAETFDALAVGVLGEDELATLLAADADQMPGHLRRMAESRGLNAESAVVHATRVAGRLNGRSLVPALDRDPRYHAERNRKEPRTLESELGLYDCVNCDLCIAVCPNDAFFVYDVVGDDAAREHQLALVDEACNECSNCEVYCPEIGAPFVVKERVFATAEGFAASTRDGFRRDGSMMEGRVDGHVFRMDMGDGNSDDTLSEEERSRADRVRTTIFAGPRPNPVNPSGGGS